VIIGKSIDTPPVLPGRGFVTHSGTNEEQVAGPPLSLAGKQSSFSKMKNPMLSELSARILITRRQLAERWQCSVPTIKRRERAGAFPVSNLGGGLVRYDLEDIEAFEAETKVRRA
jgi:predicted DNA-binding transcriptional regulator AlpA